MVEIILIAYDADQSHQVLVEKQEIVRLSKAGNYYGIHNYVRFIDLTSKICLFTRDILV